MAIPTHGPPHHWPPLHIVIPICYHWSSLDMVIPIIGHPHYRPFLHMVIIIIGHPYTWSSSSFVKHASLSLHCPPLHIVIIITGHPYHWPPQLLQIQLYSIIFEYQVQTIDGALPAQLASKTTVSAL